MKVPNSELTRQILSNKRAIKALYSALSNPNTPIPLKNGKKVYLSSISSHPENGRPAGKSKKSPAK